MFANFLKIVLIHLMAFYVATAVIGCGRIQKRIFKGGPTDISTPRGESFGVEITAFTSSPGTKSLAYTSYVIPPKEIELLNGSPEISVRIEVGTESCSYVFLDNHFELEQCSTTPFVAEAGEDIQVLVVGKEDAQVRALLEIVIE